MVADKFTALIAGEFIGFQNTDFTLKGHTFVSLKKHYYEVLFDGDIKLLKRNFRKINFFQYDNMYDGEIISELHYYLQFPDNSMKEFKMNKKSIAQILAKENYTIDFVQDSTTVMNENIVKQLLENNKIK